MYISNNNKNNSNTTSNQYHYFPVSFIRIPITLNYKLNIKKKETKKTNTNINNTNRPNILITLNVDTAIKREYPMTCKM